LGFIRKRNKIKMELTKAKIETCIKYHYHETKDDDNPYNSHQIASDILRLTIPLLGGAASYEIPLATGVRENIEWAMKLSEKGKI
jgi:hypothetical protein